MEHKKPFNDGGFQGVHECDEWNPIEGKQKHEVCE